jgi:hypothetical protein
MNRKLTILFVALLVTIFTASSAMAWILNARSEEMTANSTCDFAGTITLTFGPSDATIINTYLATNDYVLIRVSLSGTDLGTDPDVPILCKDIAGSFDGSTAGAQGGALPNTLELVALDQVDVEVSNGAAAGTPDIDAYVYGDTGDQYFEIYLTAIPAAANGIYNDESTYPWIKVGLYEELDLDGPDDDPTTTADNQESTAICANVQSFSGLSKLTVSIDNTPSNLSTTTSDNQIGHFLAADIDLLDCTKTELDDCSVTETIEDCPISPEAGGQSVTCPTYSYCFTADGDFPAGEDIDIYLRTNGPTSASAIQDGVTLRSLVLYDEAGVVIPEANYTITWANEDPGACTIANNGSITFQDTVEAEININTSQFMDGGTGHLQFCISYMVDTEEVSPGDDVQLWVNAETVPCGSLFAGVRNMASIIECGSTPYCMYFPYVLTGSTPWQTGVVISNVGSDVGPSDMEVIFTLTDSTGAQFTYTKDDFTSVVYTNFLDTMLDDFSDTPAAGPAWLKVQGNFVIDGYSFLTNGTFGAGTLPRPLVNCTSAEGPMALSHP